MSGFERLALLLSLMRELGEVMRAETELVQAMHLDRLTALQAEKVVLAEAYERALRQMRAEPATLATLDDGSRAELERAMRRFQLVVRGNVHRLRAAREVVEGVMGSLGRSLNEAVPAYGQRRGGATIVPLSLDRRA